MLHPIAGSRPRGATPEDDNALAEELLADEKERAEHLMLVDLGRNDLGRVCAPGTVEVVDFMSIERYSHVMHIVSTVVGTARRRADGVRRARGDCFPAGTLSGAPKPRAMEIIDELEPTRRGVYGGAVGYLDFAGDLDIAIAIRTGADADGVAYVQAGGGRRGRLRARGRGRRSAATRRPPCCAPWPWRPRCVRRARDRRRP